MQQRPRIIPRLSKTDKRIETAGTILLLAIWGFTMFAYVRFPETIPIHFNASGKADDFGHKATFLLLPAIATILYWGLTTLNKYPHLFNYMVRITEANAPYQYKVATRMIRYLKLGVIIIFSMIMISVYLTSIGKTDGISRWFLFFAIIFLLFPVFYAVIHRKEKSQL